MRVLITREATVTARCVEAVDVPDNTSTEQIQHLIDGLYRPAEDFEPDWETFSARSSEYEIKPDDLDEVNEVTTYIIDGSGKLVEFPY